MFCWGFPFPFLILQREFLHFSTGWTGFIVLERELVRENFPLPVESPIHLSQTPHAHRPTSSRRSLTFLLIPLAPISPPPLKPAPHLTNPPPSPDIQNHGPCIRRLRRSQRRRRPHPA